MVMHKESLHAEAATNVLIFTAAIGGGHEALARSIRADLERARHNVILLDGLRELSPVMAWAVKWGYLFQLRFAPMTIGPLFRIKTQPWIAARLRSCYGILYGWRLMRSIRRNHPDVIVSTYPVITSILDWLRRTGRLTIPVVTVIADYGVHALWIGPSTESHLVSSQPSQALVFDAGGRERSSGCRFPLRSARLRTRLMPGERSDCRSTDTSCLSRVGRGELAILSQLCAPCWKPEPFRSW